MVVVVTRKYIVRERNVVIVCVTVCEKHNVSKYKYYIRTNTIKPRE